MRGDPPRTLGPALTAVVIVLVTAGAVCADPPRRPSSPTDDAAQLVEQMKLAGAGVRTFSATVDLSIRTVVDRWTRTQETQYRIAFDRAGARLLIDRPDLLLVCDAGRLRVRSGQYPGRFVDVAAPPVLNYGTLVGVVPFLGEPPLPVLMPMLSDDPIAQLASGAATVTLTPPDPDDSSHRRGVVFPTPVGPMTLRLDPDSRLVTGARLELAGGATLIRYEVRDLHVNEPLDPALFAFDTQNQTAVASVAQLAPAQPKYPGITAGRFASPPGNAPAPAAPEPPPAAPPVRIVTADDKPFNLADRHEQVAVLCFWASWSPQCRQTLDELEKVNRWIGVEKKSAAVYAVNVMEPAAVVQEVFAKQGWTFTSLRDGDGKLADSFVVQVLPHTVIVAAGRIVWTAPSGSADLADKVQQQIEELTATP